ncbi:ImmA/IrrE family metallo-endopeptidase [Carnobacterium maltaromaticum]|uniref:ImmA/IrrE family metallo-endopeptidase n=1 Tax=Carnobacterium maltaromaticum TaxID=2751 RepID=UPI0039BE0916
MNKLEKIMDKYSELAFNLKQDMNDKHGAFIIDKDIYINGNNSYEQIIGNIGEELGHYETSVGDLTKLDTIEKQQQERRARQWAYRYLVPLDDLIVCHKLGLIEYWEIADFLEITPQYLWESINYYKEWKGLNFKYKECLFVFGIADSLKIIFPN